MQLNLTGAVDPRPLGLSRIIVGAAALLRAFVAIPILVRLSNPDTLRAPNFSWFPAPTTEIVWFLIAAWIVSALLFMLGWRARLSGAALALVVILVIALDRQTYSNHLYLMVWLTSLLVLADSGAGLAVGKPKQSVAFWPVLLLCLQISIVYLFSALTKINDSFISGEVLAGVLRGGLIDFPESLRTPQLLAPLAASVIVIEVFVALGLWVTRWRAWAIVLGVTLHGGITLLMAAPGELLVFSMEMLAIYPLFMYGAKLEVSWNPQCSMCVRRHGQLTRMDVMGAIETRSNTAGAGQPDGETPDHFRTFHRHHETRGFWAWQRAFEHVVPGIWLGPFLRVPVLRHAGSRWWNRNHASPTEGSGG